MKYVMVNACLDCGRSFDKEAGLHLHISKTHGSLASYYHTHFPRFDKYDGAPIYFKDKKFYVEHDFNSRANQQAWLKTADREEVRQFVRDYFVSRKLRKGLVKAPTQIELRSLVMPGKKMLSELFVSYRTFFDSIGLSNQFSEETLTTNRDISKQKIIVDTREQKPLEFDSGTRSAALKFGDYRLSNDTVSDDCYVERKSIMDFHGTMVKGFDRFLREVGRAYIAGAYLIVLVEGTLEDLYGFSNSHFFHKPLSESRQREHAVTSPQSVLGKMRDAISRFNNIQFLFVKDRETSARIIERLFASNGEYKKCDLQYLYDLGLL